MIDNEYKEAFVEVLDIIENSEENIKEKISEEMLDFLKNNKSTTYIPNLDHSKTLKEMNLKQKTKEILIIIYKNYLCNEEEREEIIQKLTENENKYQEILKQKYDNNVFKKEINSKIKENKQEEKNIKKYKKTFIQKILDKLKEIFKFK